MAREYSKTNVTIWQDNDFRALPFPVQHVYRMLWDHPLLSYCGVVDWRPARLSAWAVGLDKTLLATLTDCLRARHFIVVDEGTEECLVRSWVRWDGVIRQPRLAVSFANAYAALGSNTLRGVVIHEMKKLREREPDAAGWAKPSVQAMFEMPEIDAKTLPTPEDPFAEGFVFSLGSVSSGVSEAFGRNAEEGLGSVSVPPTPSPAPTPSSNSILVASADGDDAATPPSTKKKAAKARAIPLPDDWAPSAEHIRQADEMGLDLAHEVAKFRNHAASNDRRQARWGPTFTNWLLTASKWAPKPEPVRHIPHAADLESPPDGLSDAEYEDWRQAQAEKRRRA